LNVAQELFSKTSIAYPEWRSVILAFVEQNRYVKAGEKWKAMMVRIAEGEIEGAGTVLAEIM
jgi:hypothetical protein